MAGQYREASFLRARAGCAARRAQDPPRIAGAAVLAVVSACCWAGEPAAPGPAPEVEQGARGMAPGDLQRRLDAAVLQAKQRIEAGAPREALALLRLALQEAQSVGADTTAIRFVAAQALLRMARFAEAAEILARLAEEQPESDRVQLDYAAALFALGRDEEAAAIFREMRRRDLPPMVRRNVEGFLERIHARQRLRIDLDMGFWRDDNVNNAAERETVEAPIFGTLLPLTLDERPVRAWVVRAGAQLRWSRPLRGRRGTYIETRAAAARNTALGAGAHNRTWASLSVGPRVGYTASIAGRRRFGQVHADLGFERRWRSGDPYAASLWLGLGLDQAVADGWRAGGSTRLWTTRYARQDGNVDPRGRSFGLRGSRRLGAGWLTAAGTYSRERPARRDLRWTSHAFSLGYAASFTWDWNLSIRAHLANTGFAGAHPLFRIRREDRTRGIFLAVSHRALAWRGYLPELILRWEQTRSNLPLYDRQLRSVQLGLRRLF